MSYGYGYYTPKSESCLMFHSMEALQAHVRQIPARFHFTQGGSSFVGGHMSPGSAMDECMRGLPESKQQDAKALMDKIDATVRERTRREYVATPAGAFPVVPEYLQGLPMHMRRRVHVPSDVAPIKLVIDVGLSAGVSERTAMRRGAAVAALAVRMAETRPVELWTAYAGMPDRRKTVVIGTKVDLLPLGLGQALALMGGVGYARAVCFAVELQDYGRNTDSIVWGWDAMPGSTYYDDRLRKALNLNPEDILIPGGHLHESDLMLSNPVAWVNKYLDKQRTLDDQ